MGDVGSTTVVALFVLGTVLPYALASVATRDDSPLGGDRRRFEIALLGTGGLSIVLHVVAFTAGLSIGRVVGTMAAGVAAIALVRWQTPGHLRRDDDDAANSRITEGPRPWLTWAAALVVALVGASWFAGSTHSLDVAGTDAANYHIPHAVNYALSATPWDPPPTRHAYPMGTSLLFAWFILPFGDAYITDAAMVLHGFLLLASMAALFRSLTGLSGWTWTPWLALTLLTLPLFAAASLPSADLPYTAAFIAVAAQLVWMIDGRRARSRDWLVLGCGLGLLLSSKITGVWSATAMVLPALAVVVVRAVRHPRSWPAWKPGAALASTLAVLVGMLPGLLWLARNIWVYGQPVELYADRYYLSIAGDLRSTYRGEWSYFLWRASRRIGEWLGPWFLVSGYAVAALVAESATRLVARRGDGLDVRRLWFVGFAAAIALSHVAALIGAPWTSLESTGGFSLRYILPIWATWALIAYAALFSRWVPWHAGAAGRAAGWAIFGFGTLALAKPGDAPWCAGFKTAPAAVAGMASFVLATAWILADQLNLPRRLRTAVLVALLVLLPLGSAAWLTARHEPLRRQAAEEDRCAIATWCMNHSGDIEPHRRVYLDVRADEIRRGLTCEARRFFVASRNDLPLAFQPPRFTSLVFDSRDARPVLGTFRRRPGGATCDYLVALRVESSREMVRLAAAWLREVGTTGPYQAWRVQPQTP